jgi:hypothetical protein
VEVTTPGAAATRTAVAFISGIAVTSRHDVPEQP